MNDSLEYRRDMEFLQKSKIWNTLFDFQQSGVVSLVKLLTRYGGAILADAVGLGKTFSALGVIKYFQNNGYHTLILCPKKLRNNWLKYRVNANSRFEKTGLSISFVPIRICKKNAWIITMTELPRLPFRLLTSSLSWWMKATICETTNPVATRCF